MSRAHVQQLVAQATVYQPPQPATAEPFPLVWPSEYAEQTEFPADLVEGLLPQLCRAMIAGPSGAGKTTVAVGIAVAVAAGIAMDGREVQQGLVLYVAAEAVESTKRRVRAAALQEELTAANLPLAIIPKPVTFSAEAMQRIVDTGKAQAEKYGPVRLLVFDTLQANEPGDEKETHFSQVVAALDTVATALECCALVVHHFGKNEDSGARGSSTLSAGLDVVIDVVKRAEERVMTISKHRDCESGVSVGFQLQPHGLGFSPADRHGVRKPVTACAVRWTGAAASAAPRIRDGHQTRLVDALRRDALATGRSCWTVKEAQKLLEEFCHSVQQEPPHRNTAYKVVEALAKSGALILENRLVRFPS